MEKGRCRGAWRLVAGAGRPERARPRAMAPGLPGVSGARGLLPRREGGAGGLSLVLVGGGTVVQRASEIGDKAQAADRDAESLSAQLRPGLRWAFRRSYWKCRRAAASEPAALRHALQVTLRSALRARGGGDMRERRGRLSGEDAAKERDAA